MFSAITDPSGNTEAGYAKAGKQYKSAKKGFRRTMRQTNPLYRQMMRSGQQSNSILADYLNIYDPDAQAKFYDSFELSPGSLAQMQAGMKALDASAVTRGGLYSGKNMMAQQQLGSDIWSGQLADYLNLSRQNAQAGVQGAQGLASNRQALNNYKIGQGQMAIAQGQAQDAGNQAAFGNMMGIIGTGVGLATGLPKIASLGSALGGAASMASPQMPTYTNGRVNPYGVY